MTNQSVSGVRVLMTVILFAAILGGIGWLASLKLGFVVDTAKPPAGGAASAPAMSADSLQQQAAAFADVPLPGDLATCLRLEQGSVTDVTELTTVCARALNPWDFPAPAAIAALPAVQDYEQALHLAAQVGAGDLSELAAISTTAVYHPVSYYQQVLRSL